MAKGDSKSNREKRKPKAETPKNKTPSYMSSGSLSASQPATLKLPQPKGKK